MNSWKLILSTLVIFGAGVVTGGLLVSHALQSNAPQAVAFRTNGVPGNPWHAQSRELLRRIDRQLSLSHEQKERIEKIIAESQERTRSLWKPIAPQMGKEMQSVRDSIREELSPEQRRRFDELFRPHPSRNGELGKEKDHSTNRPAAPSLQDALTNALPEIPGTNPPAVKPVPLRL